MTHLFCAKRSGISLCNYSLFVFRALPLTAFPSRAAHSSAAPADPEAMRVLMSRLEELEARVRAVEVERAALMASRPAGSAPQADCAAEPASGAAQGKAMPT